jgi:hypothetical protein
VNNRGGTAPATRRFDFGSALRPVTLVLTAQRADRFATAYPPTVGLRTATLFEGSVIDGAGFAFVDRGNSVLLTAHWGWMPAGE